MKEKIQKFLEGKGVSYGKIEEENDGNSLVFHVTKAGYETALADSKKWEEELADGTYVAPSEKFNMHVIIFEKDVE